MHKSEIEISLIEQNLFQLYKTVATANQFPQGELTENLSWCFPENLPWPNFIYGDADKDSINEVVEQVQQKKLPAYWICRDKPRNGAIIQSNGFKKMAIWPGMILNLKNKPLDFGLSENIHLLKKEAVKDWLKIVNDNLFAKQNINDGLVKNLLDLRGQAGLFNTFNFYAYKVNKQIASVCMSFYHNNVAGAYMLATAKAFRANGFGTLLMKKIIADAKKNELAAVVLQANNTSLSLHKSLQFKHVSNFGIYGFVNN